MPIVSSKDRVGISREYGVPIKIRGGSKVEEVVRQFSEFGLITFSREQEFKSSIYYLNFFKPVEALKNLYNLGDEILILCCDDSLTNFKSRTKDFIDYILATKAEFRNRLDRITCFLIDDCDNIQERIRADRCSNPDARLIVPFSYNELIKSPLNEYTLQNRLRDFLYERDLFGIASPLINDVLFFGQDRTNLISELYGKYVQGEQGGLFGLRRIGKTSVLNLLKQRIDQSKGVAVYFDCSQYHHERWNSFLHDITIEVKKAYTIEPIEKDYPSIPSGFELPSQASRYNEAKAIKSFEQDMTTLFHQLNNTRILLIFDEIENISLATSPAKHWKEENDSLFFWQALRSISQTYSHLFSYIITGVNPKCIELSQINGCDNPIFGALRPQYIKLFNYEDVKNMVSDIGGHLGLNFEEELFTKLIEDYGGHPFLIRQVCSKINTDLLEKRASRPHTVTRFSYEKHAQDYQLEMADVIEQILCVLENYYEKEYEILKKLALNGSSSLKEEIGGGEHAISHLLGYCLIQKDDEEYFIRIKSIEEYLKNKHRFEKILTSQEEKRQRISHRRNSLETKLRGIIYFNLQMKYGGKAKETLLTLIKGSTSDTSQETKIQKMCLKDAMQELYFSQLKVIMIKNWESYQAIFSDKRRFEELFDLINGFRADAHAKEISDEDEVMLSIAFKYFEKALIELD